MKVGVVQFPGSNCDHDTYYLLKNILKLNTTFLFHKETSLQNCDLIILPGGFSFGDYLRTGAIARFSPIMKEVIKFAKNGGYVLGICNGFQILLESNLLPGVLIKNINLNFICIDTYLKVIDNSSPITLLFSKDEVFKIPIAHGDGNYFADEETLRELKENNQILFKYCNKNGEINFDANPNGSIENIAGICNKNRNVFGMMPHPERCGESILGNEIGLKIFKSLLSNLN